MALIPVTYVMADVVSVVDTAVCVDPPNTAVLSLNGISTKNHAVPSLATAHARLDAAVPDTGKNKFVATTVAVGLLANVTVWVELIAHEPVNVATRNTLGFPSIRIRRALSGSPPGLAFSTALTTLAIRSVAGRVNEKRSAIVWSISAAWCQSQTR